MNFNINSIKLFSLKRLNDFKLNSLNSIQISNSTTTTRHFTTTSNSNSNSTTTTRHFTTTTNSNRHLTTSNSNSNSTTTTRHFTTTTNSNRHLTTSNSNSNSTTTTRHFTTTTNSNRHLTTSNSNSTISNTTRHFTTTTNSNRYFTITTNSNRYFTITTNSNSTNRTTTNSNSTNRTTTNSNSTNRTTTNSNSTNRTTTNSNSTNRTTTNSNSTNRTTTKSNNLKLNDSRKDRIYWYNDSYLLLNRIEKLILIIENNNSNNISNNFISNNYTDINNNNNNISNHISNNYTDNNNNDNYINNNINNYSNNYTQNNNKSNNYTQNNNINNDNNNSTRSETLDIDAVNMITDLVKRHVISREIHFAFVLSKYLKYPNLLQESINLYQLFKEKKLKFKDKNLTTFWTGCIDYIKTINQQKECKSKEMIPLDSSFTDMVHDSWIYHTTSITSKKQKINAIHVATYLSLLSWMECTDFKRIDSVYHYLPKYNLNDTSSPQHYLYALSSYMKASTKCLREISIQEINSNDEQAKEMTSSSSSSSSAINDFEEKLQIIQKVSKEIHKTHSQGITIDSKIVAQYLQILLFFDKMYFSSKSKTKQVKLAQMAHHELILKEITFFTGLSSPTIQNTRAKSKQTPISPSTLVFQRFNDSYQLSKCIMDLEERIRKSHTFSYLSDRQFGTCWYKIMVDEFPHDLMNGSDSRSSKKYKMILDEKAKQFKSILK